MSAPGTPPIPVLEVGGTHVCAALADPDTGGVRSSAAPADSGAVLRRVLDPGGTADEVLDAIADCALLLDGPEAAAWGVAVPGPFDYARGIAWYEGVGKFDGLKGVDVRGGLLKRLGSAASELVFLNDADAFLLGEWAAGAARGRQTCAGLTLGSGVGSAFVRGGRVVDDGPTVPPQGRADLLEYAGRPLEESVSRRAIRAAYARRAGIEGLGAEGLDVHDIAHLAREDDPVARRVLRDAFTALGTVIGPWLTRFSADIVVVGGSIAESWDLVESLLGSALAEAGCTAVLLPPRLAETAGLVGAAHAARPPAPGE